MFLAVIWHFWIAVILFLLAVIPVTIGVVVAYLRKAEGPRYQRVKE